MLLKIILPINDQESLVLVEFTNNRQEYRLLHEDSESRISKEEFLEKLIATEEQMAIHTEMLRNRLADMRIVRLKVFENKVTFLPGVK